MSLRDIRRDLFEQRGSHILLSVSPAATSLLHEACISNSLFLGKNKHDNPENLQEGIESDIGNEKKAPLLDKLLEEILRSSCEEKSLGDLRINVSCTIWKRILSLCGENSDCTVNRETAVHFPGPMACTLSRREYPALFGYKAANEDCRNVKVEYLVTEKSDGIRAILYAVHEPSFFAWNVKDLERVTSLTDTLSLTKGKIQLDHCSPESRLVPLELSYGFRLSLVAHSCSSEIVDELTFCLGWSEENSLSPQIENSKVEYNIVILREGNQQLAGKESSITEQKMQIQNDSVLASIPMLFFPKCGREFVYLVDRSCDALYLFNEFSSEDRKIIQLPHLSSSVHEFVCDGELYWNLNCEDGFPVLSYSAFDLFGLSYKASTNTLWQEKNTCPSKCLQKLTLHPSERIEKTLNLGQDSSTCLRCRTYVLQQLLPNSIPSKGCLVAFLHKKYHPLCSVESLLVKIAQEHGKYIYDNQNYNDGLVFTPVSQVHFRLRPGRSALLLKWKWNEKQSIDWLVAYDKETGRGCPTGAEAKLYFYVMHKIGGAGTVLAGHALFREKSEVHIEQIPRKSDDESVCELQLKSSRSHTCSSEWVKVGDRSDKREANSLQTIRNVLEAVTENITVAEISSMCLGNIPKQMSEEDISYALPSELPPVYLLAKLYPRHDMKETDYKPVIKLQTLVNPKDFISSQFESGFSFSPHTRLADSSRKTYIPQRPFPMNIMDDTQYTFPLSSDQIVVSRAAFSMIIANTGGSETYSETVARVYFDAHQGKWIVFEILKRTPSTEIDASQIITHLLHLASLAAEKKNIQVKPLQLATFSELFALPLRTAFTEFTQDYLHYPKERASVFYHYDSISDNVSKRESIAADSGKAKNRIMETCAGIRSVNNFLKFVLLSCGFTSLRREAGENHKSANGLYLLDLCSGRGGDLMKFKHLNGIRVPNLGQTSLGGVLCVDGSLLSLGAAASRYSVTSGLSVNSTKKKHWERNRNHSCGIPARFVHADCCVTDLQPTYKDFLNEIGKAPVPFFDLVSIQFAMHYAFRSETELRRLMENITVLLRPGGILVATLVDEQKVTSKTYTESDSSLIWKSANDSCKIAVAKSFFDTTSENCSLFGRSYCFHLGDVVDGEQEYLVDLQQLLTISSEYGLSEVIACESFESVFESAMLEEDSSHSSEPSVSVSPVMERASIPSFANISHKFLKLDQHRKRESSSTHIPPVRKWCELPTEIREVCGLYKGLILRKSC
ncbi:methyltransferase [Perkinsela sp. CCAP 1560/4]|nr:methyltransferase [Perkinsela sp. CCAP 1560/4]|eukprot:KNH06810.1 methyltransferase [Perkinsela sp. CCAP 1560/4]